MSTLAIDVRRAEPRDADAIADVHRDAWLGAYRGIIPHTTLTRMVNRRGGAWWAKAIQRASGVLVVDIDGDVVGYATVGRSRTPDLGAQGEIYELYLLPAYQGVGLGRRLFRSARKLLSDNGFHGLVVWALADNLNAMAFYEALRGRDRAEGVEVFDGQVLKKVAFVWP